ncbi:hypothetical protein HPB47_026875 [Ixodes persulcatus]|uniref:Uncharacterized protein n=1 Tax=Ixodes persulcatus TaxID=34615 RepID=A0AC60PYL0_IXOPE|nr:hypothetical protein HPB47_026875 [Ixodes persulcatus]
MEGNTRLHKEARKADTPKQQAIPPPQTLLGEPETYANTARREYTNPIRNGLLGHGLNLRIQPKLSVWLWNCRGIRRKRDLSVCWRSKRLVTSTQRIRRGGTATLPPKAEELPRCLTRNANTDRDEHVSGHVTRPDDSERHTKFKMAPVGGAKFYNEEVERQRGNKELRKKIAELNKDAEEYALRLSRQNWYSLSDGMQCRVDLAQTWKLLRALVDPEGTRTVAQNKITFLMHKEGVEGNKITERLAGKYLCRDPPVYQPDYTGQPNKVLDMPITLGELEAALAAMKKN